MLKQPRQTKFKKYRKGRISPCYETRAINLQFGIYGIQALEKTKITSKQLESVRRTITNYMKRKVKI
jgi:large subunit ribosomal protein L16